MYRQILITGVTGFLGSYLAEALLLKGCKVVALKRSTSSLRRISRLASEIIFIDVETLDYDLFFQRFNSIDVIIHTATCYGRQQESVSDIFAANTEFPLRLLDAGARAGVKLFINTDTSLDKYLNIYALSKNHLLQWGKFFSMHKRIRFINFKLEHFYGPGDDPSKFATYIINSCLQNIPELKLTKGEQKRDFIYIDDVVSAYIIMLENDHKLNEAFTEVELGSGISISIKNFVEMVHHLSCSHTSLNFGALPYREGEVMNSIADISVLSNLGWSCKYDLKTGLPIVIEHEREQL